MKSQKCKLWIEHWAFQTTLTLLLGCYFWSVWFYIFKPNAESANRSTHLVVNPHGNTDLQLKGIFSSSQMVVSHVEYERQAVKRDPLYLGPERSCDRGDSSWPWQQVLHLLLSMIEQPFKNVIYLSSQGQRWTRRCMKCSHDDLSSWFHCSGCLIFPSPHFITVKVCVYQGETA